MPLYNFQCPACKKHVQKLLPHLTEDKFCPGCGTKLKRVAKPPTSRIVEERDNGLMPRKVEQLADIQEIIKDRSTEPEPDDTI